MNSIAIKRQCFRTGTRIEIRSPAPPRSVWNAGEHRQTLDVQRDGRGERFVPGLAKGEEPSLEATVRRVLAARKYILLMVHRTGEPRIDRSESLVTCA